MSTPIRPILSILNIINKSELGLKTTFGKFDRSVGVLQPGLHYRIPLIQQLYRVDLRQRVSAIEQQTVISRDNVTFFVNGRLQWNINDPEKAFFETENVHSAVLETAKIEIRNLLSSVEINDFLKHRADFSQKLLENMRGIEKEWGIDVHRLEIMDVSFQESMTRAMAVKAEADRNAEAKIINASADVETARIYKEAAEIYVDNPVSLRLREYQLWQSVSKNPASTIYVVPSNIADFLSKTRK